MKIELRRVETIEAAERERFLGLRGPLDRGAEKQRPAFAGSTFHPGVLARTPATSIPGK